MDLVRVVVLTVSQDVTRLKLILVIRMCCSSKGSAHIFHFSSYASGEFSLIKRPSCHLISMLPHSTLKQPIKTFFFVWFRKLQYSWGNIELQTGVDAIVAVGVLKEC